MWFVLGAVVLVAVVVATVSVLRRPSADDLSSVRHYHSALGTLEHLSERLGPAPAETVAADDRPAGPDHQPRFYRRPDAGGNWAAGPGTRAEGDASPSSPRRSRTVPHAALGSDLPRPGPLVFDDARSPDRSLLDRTTPPPRSRMDRAQRHALDSMNHRPRRGLTVTAVVVVALVLFGVLAFVGSGRSQPKGGTGAVSATTRRATATTAPSTHAASSKPRTKTTPTTAPNKIVAQASTAGTALYAVGESAYRLTIATSGPCWVDATSGSTGSTLWTGTMQAGGNQQIQATGTTKVELGTLAVALTVNGVPVVVPASVRSPFVVTFEPIPPAAPGAGSSSLSPSSTPSTGSPSTGSPSTTFG
jgi:hypothetical protein